PAASLLGGGAESVFGVTATGFACNPAASIALSTGDDFPGSGSFEAGGAVAFTSLSSSSFDAETEGLLAAAGGEEDGAAVGMRGAEPGALPKPVGCPHVAQNLCVPSRSAPHFPHFVTSSMFSH